MVNDYQKLHEIINEINYLIHMRGVYSSAEFHTWYINTERFLSDKYGKESPEVKQFIDKAYDMYEMACNMNDAEYDKICKEGLLETKAVLVGFLSKMQIG